MPKGNRKRAARPARVEATPARGGAWRVLLIVAAGALAYANSLQGPFVFDDRGTIVENHTIETLFDSSVLSAPRETPTAGRPVSNFSFAVNYALGGRDVTGYHVVNVALHLSCAVLFFALARRFMPSVSLAFAAALLWTLHPLNSEAVTYVTQRTEVLMALLLLLTLYASIRAHDQHSRGWAAAAVMFCALGMGAKESMAVAPIAVVLIDRVFVFSSWREAFRARAALYAGLAATWIILIGLMLPGPRSLSAGFTAHGADVWTYLLNQCVMIARYLQLAVWPVPLALYYGAPVPYSVADVLVQGLLILSLLLLTGVALWRAPKAGFLGVWFFVTLAPASSIIPIATEVGAERRMYLPLMAVALLTVLAWSRIVRAMPAQRRSAVSGTALAIAASLLFTGTVSRNRDYRSSLRLAETTVAHWPSPGAHSMLGTELAAAGRLAEAEPHLRRAAPLFPPGRFYLATVLANTGRRAEAIEEFRVYIAGQRPELDQVHAARRVLADSLKKEQRWEEMEQELRALLATWPDDADAMGQLAPWLVSRERHTEAITLYRKILAQRPNDLFALSGLGIALASTGNLDEAISTFRRVIELDPGNARARQNLQRALDIQAKKSGPE